VIGWVCADAGVLADLAAGLELLRRERRRDGQGVRTATAAAETEIRGLVHEWGARAARALAEPNGTFGIPETGRSATMSTVEAAIVLGITPRAIRALADRKRLPAVKRNGRWQFDVIDLEARRSRTA
jgi:hypothetical protein